MERLRVFDLPVEKFMDPLNERMLIRKTDSVRDAVQRLKDQDLYALLVVDEAQRLEGVLTLPDLSRWLEKPDAKVAEAMKAKPISVAAGEPVAAAMQQMDRHKITTGLPVVEPGSGRAIGFVSRFKLPEQLRRELPRA